MDQIEAKEEKVQDLPEPVNEDQRYLQNLLKKAQTGEDISPEQKIMIEMLAKSEQTILVASEEADKLNRQIIELQNRHQRLIENINNERGVARGMADALLKLKQGGGKAVH